MSAIHVVPRPSGTWVVQHEGADDPTSEHVTATEAERAALDRARRFGVPVVLVHDRYSRVRVTSARGAGRVRG